MRDFPPSDAAILLILLSLDLRFFLRVVTVFLVAILVETMLLGYLVSFEMTGSRESSRNKFKYAV